MADNTFGTDPSTLFTPDPNQTFSPDLTPPSVPEPPPVYVPDTSTMYVPDPPVFGPDSSLTGPDPTMLYVPDSGTNVPDLVHSGPDLTILGPDQSIVDPYSTVYMPDTRSSIPDGTTSGSSSSFFESLPSVVGPDLTIFGPDPSLLGTDFSTSTTDVHIHRSDPVNTKDQTTNQDSSVFGVAPSFTDSTSTSSDVTTYGPDPSLTVSTDGDSVRFGLDFKIDETAAAVSVGYQTPSDTSGDGSKGRGDTPTKDADNKTGTSDSSMSGDGFSKDAGTTGDSTPGGDQSPHEWTPPSGEGFEQGPGTVFSPALGRDFTFSQSYWGGPDGSKTFTMLGTAPDGSQMLVQQYEWEGYGTDHVIVFVDGGGVMPGSSPSGVPETGTTSFKDSPLIQMGAGAIVGGGLAAVPVVGPYVGPLAQKAGVVDNPTPDFRRGYGVGEMATGVVQVLAGVGGIAGGGTSAGAGILGAPESGGLSLGVTAVGVASAAAGYAEIVQGVANIAAGAGILYMSGSGSPPGNYLSSGGKRPSHRETEDFSKLKDILSQRSWRAGYPSRFGFPGSTRPDGWIPDAGVVIEAKNYDLSNGSGKLIDNVVKQALGRQGELSGGLKQALVIDLRGQNVTYAEAQHIITEINQRTGNIFGDRWWFYAN